MRLIRGFFERGHRCECGDRGAKHRQCDRAPVPSPSRMPSSTIGSSSRCAQRQRDAPARWNGVRPATTAAPRAQAVRPPARPPSPRRRRAAPGCAAPRPGHRIPPSPPGRRRRRSVAAQRDPPRACAPGTARRGSRRSCVPSPRRLIPVPRPTTATGSVSVSAAINVVAGVVLPMPMSPAISRSAPASTSSSAIRRPASIAATTSSAVSASSTAMLPLQRRTLCAPIDGGQRLGGVDRDVDDPHGRTREVGQHVDRGAAGVEVRHHLRGHLGGICGHARGGHTVVAGEHDHPRALELPWRTTP